MINLLSSFFLLSLLSFVFPLCSFLFLLFFLLNGGSGESLAYQYKISYWSLVAKSNKCDSYREASTDTSTISTDMELKYLVRFSVVDSISGLADRPIRIGIDQDFTLCFIFIFIVLEFICVCAFVHPHIIFLSFPFNLWIFHWAIKKHVQKLSAVV